MKKNLTFILLLFISCSSAVLAQTVIDSVILKQKSILDLSLEELINIKVFSASRKIESKNIAPATVYVITEADIINNGYYTLKDALQNVPGITAINLDFFLFGGQRGYVSNFSQTILLINGREMQNLIAAETFISSQFATHNIRQIEVMQGPGSALYGANALVGIINLITKNDSPEYEKLEVQSDIGSQNTRAVSMIFAKTNGNVRISGSARVFNSDNWNFNDFVKDSINFSEGATPLVRGTAINMQGYSNGHFTIPVSAKVSFKDFYIGTESYYIETSKGLEIISLDFGSQRDYRMLSVNYAGWNKKVNDRTSLLAEYQYSNEKFWGRNYGFNQSVFDRLVENGRDPNLPLTQEEVYENFADVYSQENSNGSKRHRVDVRLNTIVAKNVDFTAGYLFDYLDVLGLSFADNNISPSFNSNRQGDAKGTYLVTTKNALFTQAKKPLLNQQLHLTIGTRFDYHNKYGGIFNFRGGLVYTPSEKTFIKTIYGQAFREANIFEYGAHTGAPLNFDVDPARINAFELSVTQQVGSILQFMVTGYRNAVTRLIVPTSTTYFTNSSSAEIVYGLEASAVVKFNKVSSDINYSYTNPNDKKLAEKVIVDALNNYKHRVNFGISYDLLNYFKLNARINYYSKITAVHGNSVFTFKEVANPNHIPGDPTSPEKIMNPIAKLNVIPACTNVNFTISTKNLTFNGMNLRLQATMSNVLNRRFYHPNVRIGGPRQFLQPGRQFISRIVFEI